MESDVRGNNTQGTWLNAEIFESEEDVCKGYHFKFGLLSLSDEFDSITPGIL
jgi:hypothetical protein